MIFIGTFSNFYFLSTHLRLKMLKNKFWNFINWFLLGLAMLGFGSAAVANCFPVEGKIFNNGFIDAFGSITTLGVVSMKFNNNVKLKCGLRGNSKAPDDPGDIDPAVGGLNFDHVISCDDNVFVKDIFGMDIDIPGHSKLEFDTTGLEVMNPDFCAGGVLSTFEELSEPKVDTGTGLFDGVVVEGSILTVKGTVFCNLAIDMKFEGQLCFE